MKNDREFTGTLLGFDDFVSKFPDHPFIVIGTPLTLDRHGSRGRYRVVRRTFIRLLFFRESTSLLTRSSEITPKGRKSTKLAQTLLNGNNICMVSHFRSPTWLHGTDTCSSSWYLGVTDPSKHS
jgi:small nuclear ribonucleoprotein (snRNP)-like protein